MNLHRVAGAEQADTPVLGGAEQSLAEPGRAGHRGVEAIASHWPPRAALLMPRISALLCAPCYALLRPAARHLDPDSSSSARVQQLLRLAAAAAALFRQSRTRRSTPVQATRERARVGPRRQAVEQAGRVPAVVPAQSCCCSRRLLALLALLYGHSRGAGRGGVWVASRVPRRPGIFLANRAVTLPPGAAGGADPCGIPEAARNEQRAERLVSRAPAGAS